ncbi:MAG: methyltransferase domain-containing protein, partial [Acidobacteria bacterium]|nr:methyltransferase domain-containing protein [Acidobacteriota bacterium]
LGAQPRNVVEMLPNRRVLDVGTGDGDVAFFLESLGYEVEAVDLAASNHSALAGFKRLKAELSSAVELHERDIDRQFTLQGEPYGLALSLGLLYHLKNPFYYLEELAGRAHYCLASSKIADILEPGGSRDVRGTPLAYLLEADELNEDNSNFWVFTETCLKRLCERAGWTVIDALRVQRTDVARADSAEDDARLFLLLASKKLDAALVRGEGWYEREEEGWWWTASRFTVTAPLAGQEARWVQLDGFVAEALVREGANELRARVGGGEWQRVELREAGPVSLKFKWPMGARVDVQVEFEVARRAEIGGEEDRDLGMIVKDVVLG